MDIEPLRLEAGEAGGDGLEALAPGLEMVQPLLDAEIGKVIGDELVAQKGRELLELRAEDVVAALDSVDDDGDLPCILPCTRMPKIAGIL
jgi:hypothetical protein